MNLYDDARLDVAALLAAQDAKLPAPDPAARSGDGLGPVGTVASLARLYGLGALVRSGLHRRLVYANLSLDWFFEFQRYWVEELGNRPIHPHDFYFLSGVYRQRLQTIHFESLENPALASDDKHLEAWRDPRTAYYLFAHTFRLALSPLRVHPYRPLRAARRAGGRVRLRGGAGHHRARAPVPAPRPPAGGGGHPPHALPLRALEIPPPPLRDHDPHLANDDAPLPGTYDTIFCLEVFEHLPRPLPVLEHFHRVLKPGGHLVLDYVRSEATGLDSATSLRDRPAALKFVLDHFEVVQGRVTVGDEHVLTSVVRKR